MITLTFRPEMSDSSVLVRGVYFRICADATLRGPDNAVAAIYIENAWQLGRRRYRRFECTGSLYLRVIKFAGEREQIGPFSLIRAADGALFSEQECLGIYAADWKSVDAKHAWREVALLSGPA